MSVAVEETRLSHHGVTSGGEAKRIPVVFIVVGEGSRVNCPEGQGEGGRPNVLPEMKSPDYEVRRMKSGLGMMAGWEGGRTT